MQQLYGNVGSHELAVVLWPPVGSSVKQDGGLDAMHLSEAVGLPVLAVDHPGGGFYVPHPSIRKALDFNYLDQVQTTNAEAMCYLATKGIKQVLHAGRSAGGLPALAATYAASRMEGIYPKHFPRVAGVYTAETSSWEYREGDTDAERVEQGKKDYKAKLQEQAQLLAEDSALEVPQLVHPRPNGLPFKDQLVRYMRIGFNYNSDVAHNKNVWAKDYARLYALDIAGKMFETCVQLDFAAHSMMTSEKYFDDVWFDLHRERYLHAKAPGDVAPLKMERVPHTVHSSFDNRDFIAERIDGVLDVVRARLARNA